MKTEFITWNINRIFICSNIAVKVNESCFFNEQCEASLIQTECRDGTCTCRFEMVPALKDGKVECISKYTVMKVPQTYLQLHPIESWWKRSSLCQTDLTKNTAHNFPKDISHTLYYIYARTSLFYGNVHTSYYIFHYNSVLFHRRTKETRPGDPRRSCNVPNFGCYDRHVYHNLCCFKALQQVSMNKSGWLMLQ